MKVICIDVPKPHECVKGQSVRVSIGETYIVVDTCSDSDGVYYELSHHLGVVYRSDCFVPCSGVDEMELVNEEWNAQASVATEAQ